MVLLLVMPIEGAYNIFARIGYFIGDKFVSNDVARYAHAINEPQMAELIRMAHESGTIYLNDERYQVAGVDYAVA